MDSPSAAGMDSRGLNRHTHMQFQLSHFTLFPPDELLSYWFVSHDFAEELKLEHSKAAAATIKRALAPSGVKVDYEADAVTLRISRKEFVLPSLESLYALLGWSATELAALKPHIDAFKRPRPRSLVTGDIFHIPIADNLVGIGQILEINHKAPTVAVFTRIGTASEVQPSEVSRFKLLTILHIGGMSLYKGLWPVISSSAPLHNPSAGPGGKAYAVGSTSYGGDGPIVELLGAHAGHRSWSEGFHDPLYLKKLVLP